MGDKYLYKVKCNWPKCGYEFEKIVGVYNPGGGKHKNVTSSVICPRCKNYIKIKECQYIKKIEVVKKVGV